MGTSDIDMPGSRGRVPSEGSAGAGGRSGVRPSIRPSGWLGAAGLVALCLVVYLPGFFSLPPVDRDESRFAQASRQMFESVALPPAMRDPALHSGGLVIPKVQGRDRLNKPPLIYWLQAASAAVFTAARPLLDGIWMYRVPSLLGAIAAVLLTWRLGTSMFDSRTGRLAAALLACCPVVAWEARQARADMVLLALNTAAMLALWRVWNDSRDGETERRRVGVGGGRARWTRVLTFWLAVSLAILTKGPITPLVIGLTVFSLCLISRRWRWLLDLRPFAGLLIVAAVVGPWVYLVGDRVGWSVYFKTIADETLGRVASSREGHWGPPGYHTLLLAVLFWPGSLMTAAGIALAFRQGLVRAPGESDGWIARLRSLHSGHAPYLFCLCWIIPVWVVFELIWTKLPHYTLPMYPAIALLSARAVLAAESGLLPETNSGAGRLGRRAWLVIGAGLVAVAVPSSAMASFNLHTMLGRVIGFVAALTAIVSIAVLIIRARYALKSGWILRGQLIGVWAFVVWCWLVLAYTIPLDSQLWPSKWLVTQVRALDPGLNRPIAVLGYHEDSLLYHFRANIDRITEDQLDAWMAAHPDGIIAGTKWLDFLMYGRRHEGWERQPQDFHGINYSKFFTEHLALYRRVP